MCILYGRHSLFNLLVVAITFAGYAGEGSSVEYPRSCYFRITFFFFIELDVTALCVERRRNITASLIRYSQWAVRIKILYVC